MRPASRPCAHCWNPDWFLHPEGERLNVLQRVPVEEVPDREEATLLLERLHREEARRMKKARDEGRTLTVEIAL